MKRTLPFTKMHGAGNDFVMLDHRDLGDTQVTRELIVDLCDRRLGIGADGLIVIAPADSPGAAFRMVYFNADGGEAEMCGNGARCSVAFAHMRGLAQESCSFDTQPGLLSGTVHSPGDIAVTLPAYRDLELNIGLEASPWDGHHSCNTGVPHLVIPVEDIDAVDVRKWGRDFRFRDRFAPAGTNVNWIARHPDTGEFLLRTYERGVEDETLACGTGASAAAVVMSRLGAAESTVSVRTRSGDLLSVTVDHADRSLVLRGPAVTSFKGEVAPLAGGMFSF
jgi:diaminopimelate epimerase